MPDSDWIKWARREFKAPDLFLYHHKAEKTVVLAEWVVKPTHCLELWAFEVSPTREPPSREWMQNLLAPAQAHREKVRKAITERQQRERALRQDSKEQQERVATHLWKKGREAAAVGVMMAGPAYVGRAEGGAEQEALERELKGLANGRVIG